MIVKAWSPTYCDRSAWSRMNIDVLRRRAAIDCLIDPHGGDALLLNRARLLNRSMMRGLNRSSGADGQARYGARRLAPEGRELCMVQLPPNKVD
jgi:hypothetical protein